jgi:protein-disulfide isomerase
MRISTLAAAALLTTATLATSACAQSPGNQPASGAAVNADSLVARADRERMKGTESAQLTIVEVSDFQCPYCRQFATTTYRQIDSAYVRTGRARMVYINLPLSSHHNAFPAAEAAMCAGAQGKFWPMHDRLFGAQRDWSAATDAVQRFERMAQELELDMGAFRDCTQNDRTASIIVNDAMQAAGAGIQGTPAFILSSPNGQRALSGAVSFEQFSQEVDALLGGQAAPAPQQPQGGAPPQALPPQGSSQPQQQRLPR